MANLYISSLIYFGLIFVCGIKYEVGSNFILSHVGVQLSWHQFLKRAFFLQWIVLVPSWKSIDRNYEGAFLHLKSVPLLYIYSYTYANSTALLTVDL